MAIVHRGNVWADGAAWKDFCGAAGSAAAAAQRETKRQQRMQSTNARQLERHTRMAQAQFVREQRLHHGIPLCIRTVVSI